MEIVISDERKIADIQQEFNKQFPYLKLEFFSRLHKSGAGSASNELKNHLLSLGEFRTIHNSGVLTITPEMTVNRLEQQFKFIYGLSIQVFRRSGRMWLESTVTDGWTLEEQNREGEMLSTPLPKNETPEDYHDPE